MKHDDTECWRHRYNSREYICRCIPIRDDDSGFDDLRAQLGGTPELPPEEVDETSSADEGNAA